MITCKSDRMLEFLWFVGYCIEFPSQLAVRIGGHPEWNRHVMYRAIELGYVVVNRCTYRGRILRSLRLTSKGIDYIAIADPNSLTYIYAKRDQMPAGHLSAEKIMRYHALAYALVMAYNSGAAILPDAKPSLLFKDQSHSQNTGDYSGIYFYSAWEIRQSIQEYDPESVAKTSRILGVIVRGKECYCLYFTGHSRMYWMQGIEENTCGAIQTLLEARGFPQQTLSQVIIGSNMSVARKIARHPGGKGRRRYFVVSDYFEHCYYLVNSLLGDQLLKMIVDPEEKHRMDIEILSNYRQPETKTREYDAVTKDGRRPVTLNYQCDLLALFNMDLAPYGFKESPILICLDYQTDAIQSILGPMVEVRSVS